MIDEICETEGHDDTVVYDDGLQMIFECTRCKSSGTVYFTVN